MANTTNNDMVNESSYQAISLGFKDHSCQTISNKIEENGWQGYPYITLLWFSMYRYVMFSTLCYCHIRDHLFDPLTPFLEKKLLPLNI